MTTKTVKTTSLRVLIAAQIVIILLIGIVATGVLINYGNINADRDYKLCKKIELVSVAFMEATKSQRQLLNDKLANGQVTKSQFVFSAKQLDKNIKELSQDVPCGSKP